MKTLIAKGKHVSDSASKVCILFDPKGSVFLPSAEAEKLPKPDHLGQNQSLDCSRPVMKIADPVLGRYQANVPRKKARKQKLDKYRISSRVIFCFRVGLPWVALAVFVRSAIWF
jgi:hypothetical protein